MDSTQIFVMYGYDLATSKFDEYESTEYKSGEWKVSNNNREEIEKFLLFFCKKVLTINNGHAIIRT